MKSFVLAAMFLLVADNSERVIADTPVPATIQGSPARLRIDPGAPSMPVFNPDFAAKAGLRAGPFATRGAIGPVKVNGRSAVVRLDLGQGAFKRRVTWFEAPYASDADGTIGPGGLPDDRVRFVLREAAPGERSVVLPLADFGYLGMGSEIMVAAQKVRILFALARTRTIATAAAGAAIAAAQDGKFDGASETMKIRLDVMRPVRRMTLARPLGVGPLALDRIFVRTGDFGSAAAIPDANAPEVDPDEIVVTGAKAKGKQRYFVEIGRDALAGCSSILFDKPAKTVTLSCR
ncbi:hypothetical protein HZY97_12385 [Sphingomonas sp. R-74633]|uniref:hypothetical protein n=1 Tax=Sphingomonas sp. R-74633 TaxID=2751188 RepID=UPI0015D247EE|nr:hypothetical protein [Sphingomonas sp. R-74633]NYT41561.1 hypothetical protein [Sphingomonas sp. R-74633]